MANVTVSAVYYGTKEAMIAEVGAHDCSSYDDGRFYVMADGDAQFCTDAFTTIRAAKEYAKELAAEYGCKIARV